MLITLTGPLNRYLYYIRTTIGPNKSITTGCKNCYGGICGASGRHGKIIIKALGFAWQFRQDRLVQAGPIVRILGEQDILIVVDIVLYYLPFVSSSTYQHLSACPAKLGRLQHAFNIRVHSRHAGMHTWFQRLWL